MARTLNGNKWKLIGFFACAGIMLLCLTAGGILFYARDGVTPDPLPVMFTISDWIWLVLIACFFFYFRMPVVTIAAGWLALLAFLLITRRFSPDPLFWLWYDYLFLPVFIVASHVGFFLKRRSGRASVPS